EFRNKNLFNLKDEDFEKLDKFRKLRNRVHLQLRFEDDQTDWFAFEKCDYLDMKKLLYQILTSEKMFNKPYRTYIDFLK
ncbi:TPA: hypothetical protein ACRBUN_001102, partial [Streptococcus pyogenes]